MITKVFKILGLIIGAISPISLEAKSAYQTDSLTRAAKPMDRYEQLIDTSFWHGNAGRYDLAEEYLRQAIAEKPRHRLNIYLLNNLGGLQELQGKQHEALLSYSAALEQDQDEQTTRLNRAKLYASMGQLKPAITDYSLLVTQAPDNELYKYQRAMLYIWEGEYDLAEVDLSDIIRNNDSSLKARIGYALLETKRGHYTEAERLYDYLISKLPRSAEVYEGRARLYLLQGKRGFALRDLERAMQLSVGQPSVSLYRLRQEIAIAMGDDKIAREAQSKLEELVKANK
ncbi:MAG: hypothetical protein Q4A61_01225 [Porphyromonadaceae bacterium]|nr:hypothetical protein [Porphyromonadaceae bacterium]